jgi:hypothetical protein
MQNCRKLAATLLAMLVLFSSLAIVVPTAQAAYYSRTVLELTVTPDPVGVGQWTWFLGRISPGPPVGTSYHNLYFGVVDSGGGMEHIGPLTSFPGSGSVEGSVYVEGYYTPQAAGIYRVYLYSPTNETLGADTYSAFSSQYPSLIFPEFIVQEEPVPYPWPTAIFSYSPSSPCIGQDVLFDASASYDSDGTIVNYLWYSRRQDGSLGGIPMTSTASSTVVLSFSETGTFDVTLQLTDDDGYHNQTTQQIVVREAIFHTLTIAVEGPGRISDPPLGVHTFFENDDVSVSASPNEGCVLDHWLIDGAVVPTLEYPKLVEYYEYHQLMDTDHTITAVFTVGHKLTIRALGPGSTTPEGVCCYPAGTNAEVNANANPGCWLKQWVLDGDIKPATNTYILKMDGDHTLDAVFTNQLQFSLTVISSGWGSTNASQVIYYYASGANSDFFTAEPDEGCFFKHWTLNDTTVHSSDLTTFVAMDNNYKLTAVFEKYQFDLTIIHDGEGSTSPGEGIHHYDPGFNVTGITAEASEGWYFSRWKLDGVDNGTNIPHFVVMDADHTLTAVFEKYQFDGLSLTIDVVGSGYTIPGRGGYTHDEGEVVTVNATADSGWMLHHWTLNEIDVGSTNPYTFTMDRNYALVAVFTKEWSLRINVTGSGSTDPTTRAEPYYYGDRENVTVTATAASGWVLDHWDLDGNNVSSASSYNVTMDNHHVLCAVYVQVFDVTIGVGGSGGYTNPSGVQQVKNGTSVTVTATAASGWVFHYWELDGTRLTSTSTSISLVITEDCTLEAFFDMSNPTAISVKSIGTDKDRYRRGESVHIQLTAVYADGGPVTTGASTITILDPSGQVISTLRPRHESNGLWTVNWVVPPATSIGFYTVKLDVNGIRDGLTPQNSGPSSAVTFDFAVTRQVNLTISVFGEGKTSPAAGSQIYDVVDSPIEYVTISATAAEGWNFSHWLSGYFYYLDNPREIPLIEDINYTAVFVAIEAPSREFTYEITINKKDVAITAATNSTITYFHYNQTSHEFTFEVSGLDGTYGIINMTVPKAVGSSFSVKVDEVPVSFTQTENATHYFLCFTYPHSMHTIKILALEHGENELNLLILLLIVVVTVVAGLLLFWRRRSRNARRHSSESNIQPKK